jgi:hypothetical protein
MSQATLSATLQVAADVLEVVREEGFDAVVIGAIALAVHGYARATEDLDIAVAVPLGSLRRVAATLRDRGYEVQLREPDGADPLGGVIDVQADGADLVQVVNFDNQPAGGFPRLVADALAAAEPLTPGAALRVVDPYHLVAFKLYAGGAGSKLDILELLDRNPDLDMARLRALCAGYRLETDLDEVLALGQPR